MLSLVEDILDAIEFLSQAVAIIDKGAYTRAISGIVRDYNV